EIAVPNWLPMAGGVGPNATQMSCGGEEVDGYIEPDKEIWCGWLALDKPGEQTGDHVTMPVSSVTITVAKFKPANVILLFPESIGLSGAQLTIPGCKAHQFPNGPNVRK